MVCGHVCLVFGISNIGLTEVKGFGVWYISQRKSGSTTIKINLRFMSNRITNLSSVTYKMVVDLILVVLVWLSIFVAPSIFPDQILYFVPELWGEGRTESFLSRMLLLLKYVFPDMMVACKWSLSRRDILYSSPQFFLS